MEEERKVDGVTRRKGRRGKGEERGREGERASVSGNWRGGGASDFFLATHWVLGGPKASLKRRAADHEGPRA